MVFIGGPDQAGIGLQFESGVVVAFDLGAEDQSQQIVFKGNLVLDEETEHVVRLVVVVKDDCRLTRVEVVPIDPVAQAPDDLLAPPQGESVLEVDIQRVAGFFEQNGFVPPGVIVIGLQGQVGFAGKRPLPAQQQIAT